MDEHGVFRMGKRCIDTKKRDRRGYVGQEDMITITILACYEDQLRVTCDAL